MRILKPLHQLFLVVVLLDMPVVCIAATGYLGVDADYKTGKFGTPFRTDLYSINLSAGYYSPQFFTSITLPYHSLKADDVGEIDGKGDILLHIGSSFTPGSARTIIINTTLAIKLPTADETTGLGTGKSDIGVLVNVTRNWGTFSGSLGFGYTIMGDTGEVNYNDIFNYSISLYKNFQRYGIYTSLEQRESIINGIDDPTELYFGGFYFLSSDVSLVADTFMGLNDGSPDYGVKFGIFKWFHL